MRPAFPTRATRDTAHLAPPLALAALLLVLSSPGVVLAQQEAASQESAVPDAGDVGSTDDPLTFLDSVTVSATLRPAPVRETPGMVSVIDSQTIEERLVRDFADLVKYEPGVYIENNVTRLGLNGFNIRGIGGNRVMTQVDGVQTSEQFDFGPFNVHQIGLDVDALKTVEIVRSANSALYGSDALGGVVSLFTKDPGDYLRGRGVHLGAKTTWDGRSDAINGNLALAAGTERVQGSLFASAHRGNEIRNRGYRRDRRRHPHGAESAGHQGPAAPGQARPHAVAGQHAADERRGLRHAHRDRVVLGPRPAGLRPLPVPHGGLGRGRHPGPPARVGRPHARRPRPRPALVASVRPVQRHVAGHRPRADDLRLRSAVSLPAARHARLRAGRLRDVPAGPAVARRTGARGADHDRRQLQIRLLRYPARPDRDPRDNPGARADEPDLPYQVLPGEHRLGGGRLPAGRVPARPPLVRARRALRPFRARRQPERSGLHREPQPRGRRLLGRGRCLRSWAWRRI